MFATKICKTGGPPLKHFPDRTERSKKSKVSYLKKCHIPVAVEFADDDGETMARSHGRRGAFVPFRRAGPDRRR